MSLVEILGLSAWALAGGALGTASLVTLRRTAELYATRPGRAVALHAARLLIVGAALVVAALQGAGPLIALAAGLMLVRPFLVRRLGGLA